MLSQIVAGVFLIEILSSKRLPSNGKMSISPDEPMKTCPADCKTWFDGCDWCSCDEFTGEATCEPSLDCVGDVESYCEEYYACPEGCSTFFDGCNTYECDPDTGDIMANLTGRECQVYRDPQCRRWENCPDDCLVFNDGCNSCTCTENGKIGGCTRKFCQVKGEPYCEEWDGVCPPDCNTTWFDGCNTCDCATGVCTLKLCDEAKMGEPKCVEEDDLPMPMSTDEEEQRCWNDCEHYYDGCNWCFCHLETGKTACTKKYCAEPTEPYCFVEKNDEYSCPDPNCHIWSDGCNTCECDHKTGKHKCTNHYCFWEGTPSCLACKSNFEFNQDASPCWQSNTCANLPVHCAGEPRPMCTCPKKLPIYDPDTHSCVSESTCDDETCICKPRETRFPMLGRMFERYCGSFETELDCANNRVGICDWECQLK